MAPAGVLALCVVAGVGTVLLLPARREASIRKIGGAVLLSAGLIFAALLVRWTAGSAAWGNLSHQVYFWIFSAIALVGAVRVVTHAKPVYSALYFVLTVFASAGLFLLLQAEFMAAALVLIYAGAILITYVFVIMLAAEASGPPGSHVLSEHDLISRDPLFASAIGFALAGIIRSVDCAKSQATPKNPAPANTIVQGQTQELGAFLFQNQLINLDLAGLIRTIAMVGAIMIARRRVWSEDEPVE